MSRFLSAEWNRLIMFNYAVEPEVLQKYLPAHTELDIHNGICYVSLVGFMFQKTRVLGVPVPFHINFEEINLRFYVRRKEGNTWKRGVVFVREIVPKRMITFVANTVYGENYRTMKMDHLWEQTPEGLLDIRYTCFYKDQWHIMAVKAEPVSVPIPEGSEAEFITEHYWGYARKSDALTMEYEVRHPRWNVYPIVQYALDFNFEKVYGPEFSFLFNLSPVSVFLAEGSPVEVMKGRGIR